MTKFNLKENIKSFVSVSIAKDKKIVSIIDTLVDNGEKACNYKKASAISEEMYNERKSAIPLGFSAYIQRLLNSDTKELSDIEKSDKRYWQQQIGAKMNDIYKALTKRESNGGNGTNKKKDIVTFINESCQTIVDRCQREDTLPFDFDTLSDAINKVRKSIDMFDNSSVALELEDKRKTS
tara:strand:+ start:2439 stop:2978 length:540 start_codon:yes stop_codon:yes gene_type:complete